MVVLGFLGDEDRFTSAEVEQARRDVVVLLVGVTAGRGNERVGLFSFLV